MSANRRQLLRQLEGRLRNGNGTITDIRWQLAQTGMTEVDVRAFERTVRHTIRAERAGRRAA
ncbi:hypothetical protein ABT010_13220 [Streptomyces sp. NPDC002668]|uniref:hypothetical protein n=1 Tax=Streptomyces sp. NPDC002668 TaxID=3154422 RepID=UPI0033217677